MIANMTRGGGARGVLNYVFGPGRLGVTGRAELVGGTMAGWDARSLAREFGALRTLRPDIVNPVKHVSFALPDGESLALEQALETGADLAARMGWTTWCLVKHSDKHNEDWHLVASRIRDDGTVAREVAFDVRIAEEVCRAAEQRYGLRQVDSPERTAAGKAKPKRDERPQPPRPTWCEAQMQERTQELSAKQAMAWRVQEALGIAWDGHSFLKGLESQGVAIITQRKKDVISGVTFVDRVGATWKGSEVGASARQLGNAGMLDAPEADYKKHNERARTWQACARDPEPAPEEEEVSHARTLGRQFAIEDFSPGERTPGHPAPGTPRGGVREDVARAEPGDPLREQVLEGNAIPDERMGPGPSVPEGAPTVGKAGQYPGGSDAPRGPSDHGGSTGCVAESGAAAGPPGFGSQRPSPIPPADVPGSMEPSVRLGSGGAGGGRSSAPVGPHPAGEGDRVSSPGLPRGQFRGDPVVKLDPRFGRVDLSAAGAGDPGRPSDPARSAATRPPKARAAAPALTRVLAQVTSGTDLPTKVHPDELPAVVEAYGKQAGEMVAAFDDYVEAEMIVRAAYKGLPQIAEVILRARSWAERAKDLVADGWAWIRGGFRRSPHLPEPVQETPDLVREDPGDRVPMAIEAMDAWREDNPDTPKRQKALELDRAKTEAMNRSLQASKDPHEGGPGGFGGKGR